MMSYIKLKKNQIILKFAVSKQEKVKDHPRVKTQKRSQLYSKKFLQLKWPLFI